MTARAWGRGGHSHDSRISALPGLLQTLQPLHYYVYIYPKIQIDNSHDYMTIPSPHLASRPVIAQLFRDYLLTIRGNPRPSSFTLNLSLTSNQVTPFGVR